jgi:ribosome maturation factor RimP
VTRGRYSSAGHGDEGVTHVSRSNTRIQYSDLNDCRLISRRISSCLDRSVLFASLHQLVVSFVISLVGAPSPPL